MSSTHAIHTNSSRFDLVQTDLIAKWQKRIHAPRAFQTVTAVLGVEMLSLFAYVAPVVKPVWGIEDRGWHPSEGSGGDDHQTEPCHEIPRDNNGQ